MPLRRDIILGRIVLERGLVTERQLEECLKAQLAPPSDPDSTIGSGNPRPLLGILIERGFIKDSQAAELLEEQNRRLQIVEDYQKVSKTELELGQLLVKHNKATQIQINKCLEIQEKLAHQGKTPVPRLGELLVQYGYVDAKTIQELLHLQHKDILICTNCAKQFNVIGIEKGKTYRCRSCGGIMVTRDLLGSLHADQTAHGFELPTTDAPLPPEPPS